MVSWGEDVVVPRLVNEALPQLLDFTLKLIGSEDLVRKRREGEVKVIRQLLVLQF